MSKKVPEVTIRVDRIRKNTREGAYELHIGKVVEVRNWDKRREQPRRNKGGHIIPGT